MSNRRNHQQYAEATQAFEQALAEEEPAERGNDGATVVEIFGATIAEMGYRCTLELDPPEQPGRDNRGALRVGQGRLGGVIPVLATGREEQAKSQCLLQPTFFDCE